MTLNNKYLNFWISEIFSRRVWRFKFRLKKTSPAMKQISIYLTYLWLFLSVVPKVLSPVICLDSLKILKILKILNIWSAFAIYLMEYCEERRFREIETKKGRIPRRSILFRNEKRKSI